MFLFPAIGVRYFVVPPVEYLLSSNLRPVQMSEPVGVAGRVPLPTYATQTL